jgi:hypothetical protein
MTLGNFGSMQQLVQMLQSASPDQVSNMAAQFAAVGPPPSGNMQNPVEALQSVSMAAANPAAQAFGATVQGSGMHPALRYGAMANGQTPEPPGDPAPPPAPDGGEGGDPTQEKKDPVEELLTGASGGLANFLTPAAPQFMRPIGATTSGAGPVVDPLLPPALARLSGQQVPSLAQLINGG